MKLNQGLALMALLSLLLPAAGRAHDWKYDLEIYLLGAGLDGTAGAGPLEAEVDVSFGDILDNLAGIVCILRHLHQKGALPPGEGGLNPNSAYPFMWHSHTEKELTNFDIFPGGMLSMMVVEPPGTVID